MSIGFGDHGIDVPICYGCIGPTIKREVEQRNAEIQAERDAGDHYWSNTPKDKPSSQCWSAVWYLHHPEDSNAQHPFIEGFPWTPDWMKK
jgi:hypothetical protein